MASPNNNNKTKKSKKREREANKMQKLLHDKKVEEKRLNLLAHLYERKVPTLTSICLQYLTRYTIKKPKQRRIQLLSLTGQRVIFDHHIPHSPSSSSLTSSFDGIDISSSSSSIPGSLSSSSQSVYSSTYGTHSLSSSFSGTASLSSSTSGTTNLSSSTSGTQSFTFISHNLSSSIPGTQSLSTSTSSTQTFYSSTTTSHNLPYSSSSSTSLDLRVSTESTSSSNSTNSSEELGERERERDENPFFYPSPNPSPNSRSKHANNNNNNNNNNFNYKNNKKGASPRNSQTNIKDNNNNNNNNSTTVTPPKIFSSSEDLKGDIPLEATFYYQIAASLQEAFQRVTLEEHIRRFMLKLMGEYLKDYEEAAAKEKDGLRLTEIYLSLLPNPGECRKLFAKRFPQVSKTFDLALAYVYWQRGDVALADTHFRTCVSLSQIPQNQTSFPSSAHLCREAARLHYHFGGYDFAREYYEEAEHHNPTLQDLISAEIACLGQDRERGDLDEAAGLWRSIVERGSSDEFLFPNLDTDEVNAAAKSSNFQIRIFERMVDCFVRVGRLDDLFDLLQQADTIPHHTIDEDDTPTVEFLQTKYYMSYVKALNREFVISRDLWALYWAREYPFGFLQTHNEFTRAPTLNVLWEFNYGQAGFGNFKQVPNNATGRISPKFPHLYEFFGVNFEFPGRLGLFLDRAGKCVCPPQPLQLQDTIFRQQLYSPFPYTLFDNPWAVCYAIQNMTFCYIFRSLYGTNPPIMEQIDFTEIIFKKLRRGTVRESPPPKKTSKEMKEEKKMKKFLKKFVPDAAPSPTSQSHKLQIIECTTVSECVVVVGYDFGSLHVHILSVLHPTMAQILGFTIASTPDEVFHIRQGESECCIVSCRNTGKICKYFVVNSQGNVSIFEEPVNMLFYMEGHVYGITDTQLTQYTTNMEILKSVDVELDFAFPNEVEMFQWNKHSDLLGIVVGGNVVVFDSSLEEKLNMEFEQSHAFEKIIVMSANDTRTLLYAEKKFHLFEGVTLLCSVAEDQSFRGVLAGHCVAKGFVVFGSNSIADLVTMFYFDDLGKLKGIYPNLIPGPHPDDSEWESFIDEEHNRVIVSEGGGRILCISLDV